MDKKTRAFLGLLTLSSSLISCSLKSETELYTIEFYTDYDGIAYESSKLDKSLGTLVGKGYVAVDGSNRVARLTSLEKDDEGKAIDYQNSRRAPIDGHTYTWDSWVGFYDDGNPVDLKNITGDCAVFAHFKDECDTFCITIQNVDSSEIFSGKAAYGSELGAFLKGACANDEELGQLKDKLNGVAYPLPHHYYQQYDFSGKYQYEDGDGNLQILAVDDLLNSDYLIKDDLKITAYFAEPKTKKYKVTFYSDSTLSSKLDGEEDVTYGEKVIRTLDDRDDGAEGLHYYFAGWQGSYGNGDDVPSALRSKEVDTNHILYDCSLYPAPYRSEPYSYKVTFVDQNGGSVEKKADHGTPFGDVEAPDITGLDASSKVFTGLWSTTKNDIAKANVIGFDDKVTSDMTVYPIIVDASFAQTNGKGDSCEYIYSTKWGGYLLSRFEPASTRLDERLEADDLQLPSSAGAFGLVGISRFGTEKSDYVSSLTQASFPASIVYVASNAFRGNRSLASLNLPGLTDIDPFAFSQLYSLSSFTLPSTIVSIGSRAFFGCSALIEINVDLTEENAAKVAFSEDWNRISSDKVVNPTYKS